MNKMKKILFIVKDVQKMREQLMNDLFKEINSFIGTDVEYIAIDNELLDILFEQEEEDVN